MSKAKKRKGKSASARASAYIGAARTLPILAFVWIGLSLASVVATPCPAFTIYYFVYLIVELGLAAASLAFLNAVFRKGRKELHPSFKKFLGYGLVVQYAAAALPRVDWASAGRIGQGRVVYMFALAMVCLAAGVVLFVACGRPAAYAALGLIADAEVRDAKLRKKKAEANRKKGILHGALEWVDALGFAAILVILIQTFVFQLYEIPTESMVPAFLKSDRPFTAKFDAGPRVPLTDWRLPFLRLPQRGDIITIANPRYPENQSVNLKKYLAQFVSMITFTAVNIDKYLPDGSEKADPLVKRLVGLPGERLMMVDDVLYARRQGDEAFTPVEEDRSWARTDLWKESPDTISRIENLPIDEAHRGILNTLDAKKRGVDAAALAASIASSAKALSSTTASEGGAATAFLADLAKTKPDRYKLLAEAMGSYVPQGAVNPMAASSVRADDLALALALAISPASRQAALRASLAEYAACPASGLRGADDYERGGRTINLLIKDNLLKRAVRDAQLLGSGLSSDAIAKDKELAALAAEGRDLDYYVNGPNGGLYDQRNFPPFPAVGYLGPQQYFGMGDNRYDSLDFRYRTGNYSWKPLDPADPASVLYYSNVDPFALDLKFIEGYALFRVWPPGRVGAIR
jgi:signal peptidase I